MHNKINFDLSSARLRAVDDALAVLEDFARNLRRPPPATGPAPTRVDHDLNLVPIMVPRQLRLQCILDDFESGNFFWPGTLRSLTGGKPADAAAHAPLVRVMA